MIAMAQPNAKLATTPATTPVAWAGAWPTRIMANHKGGWRQRIVSRVADAIRAGLVVRVLASIDAMTGTTMMPASSQQAIAR